MTLKLTLLGDISIEYGGETVELKLRKAEAILYYIALNGRTSRDELKSVFWHDKDDLRASANLRNAIYLINENMPGMLNSDKRHISVRSYTTDLEDMTSVKEPARPIPQELFYAPLKDIAQSGSETFSAWLDAARSKITNEVLELLRERLAAAYETHAGGAVEETLRSILRIDPYDEEAVLELMEHYAVTGRASKASEVYKKLEKNLNAGFGSPVSDRVRLYYDKLFDAGVLRPDAGAKFWCRSDELAAIRNELESRPCANVIYVHGEAGIGKTSLINKALSSPVITQRYTVLSSKGVLLGGYDYASWNNIVISLGTALEKINVVPPTRSVSLISVVFPGFMKDTHFSFNADIAMMTNVNPVGLSMILAEMLRTLASHTKVALVFEDVHRFDIRSIELMEALLSFINFPLKVIISSRPESETYLSRMFRRQGISFLDVSLKPFTREEILFISRSVLPKSTIESRGASYFVNESEGIPLMLFEMLRLLREDPSSDCANGLGSLILERIDRLSEAERSVLLALSVCTAGCPELIAETSGLSLNEAIQAAEVLLQKYMIEEQRRGGAPFWCFAHQKVRECIYNSIPLSKRQDLHRRAALSLEKRYSPQTWDPELSAAIRYHCVAAGEKGLELKQYLRELVLDVTLNHDIFPTLQDRLLLSCAAPFSSRSETERKISKVLEILNQLREKVNTNHSEYVELEATCFEIIGDYMISWGEYAKGVVYINEASSIAQRNGLKEIFIYCLKHLSYMHLQTENDAMLLKISRKLIAAAKDAAMPQYLATAVRHAGMAYFMKLDFKRAEQIFLFSIKLFEQLKLTGKNYTLSILVAKCYLGEIYQRLGRLQQAASVLKECTSACERLNLYWGRSYFLAIAADIALDMNDMQSFYAYVDEGVSLFESYKGGRCGYKLYSLKAMADLERSDFIGAKYALEKSAILLDAVHTKEGCAAYHLAQAWDIENDVEFRKDEARRAEELYRQIGFTYRAGWIAEKFSLDVQ